MNLDIANMVLNIGQNTSKDWVDILSAIGPTLMGLLAFIAAIIANCISDKNLKQHKKQFLIQLKEDRANLKKQLELQKEQWLNEAYIKKEAEVILDFRTMIHNACNSFNWFYSILTPYKTMVKMFPEQDVKLKENELIVKFEDYCKHYDCINRINNFYNNYQTIFRKHDIQIERVYISAILCTCCWLKTTDDFKYDLVIENSECVKYKLNIIDTIGKCFVSQIEFSKNPHLLFPEYTEEKLKKYSNEIMSIYHNLMCKLDKIITFYADYTTDKPDAISYSLYPTSKELIKSIKKVQNDNN